MAKFFLFVAVLAAVFMLLRASQRRRKPPPAVPQPEAMAQCAQCGVYFPRAESVGDGERSFCCEAHRRLGARP